MAAALLAIILKVPAPAKAGTGFRQQLAQLDPLGTLCFLPGIVCLLLALQWGGSQYAWNDARVIAPLILSGLLIIAFVGIQIWKQEAATVPPRIFKKRSISAGFVFSLCNGASMMIMVYYLPLWFQAVKGVDPIQSGINTLAFLISLAIAAMAAGATVSAIGYYVPLMIAGPIIMSIGAGLMTTFRPDTGEPSWIGYQILFGFGTGMGMQQASVAAQTVLVKQDVPIGSALMMFALQLSGAVFVSVGQNVFANRLVSGLGSVVGLNALVIVNTGATDLRSVVPPQLIDAVLLAYNSALTSTFTVGVATAALCILPALAMEWKSVKGRGPGGGPKVAKDGEEVENTQAA